MKHRRSLVSSVAVLSAAALFAGVALVPASGTGASAERTAPSRPAIATSACVTDAQVAAWPLERLAMQTIAVPVEETDVSSVDQEVSEGVGGIVLFGTAAPSNLGSDLATVENDYVPGKLGLLVMTDEEGGEVQRMYKLVGSLPWAAWMGHYWSSTTIESKAEAVAKKMAAANVNMDLAPVVDVDGTNAPPSATDPDGWRSFSGHTSVVLRDGVAFMKGMVSGGVIPVLKHFPGLGGASGNTDDGPAHTLAWSELLKVAIPPFRRGIAEGAPAIMVSNATVPGLATYPASLSPTMIHKVLKERLGFKGLVITDSLSAGAISGAGFTVPEAAVQALRAGADMTMFALGSSASATQSETQAVASAIVSAVNDGRIKPSRLVNAAEQVLAVHHRICA